MRLNAAQVERTLSQFEAQVLPKGHPADVELSELFGDHTFFLDSSGVSILDPAEAADEGIETGEIITLANWTDSTFTKLRAHDPERTGVLVELGSKH